MKPQSNHFSQRKGSFATSQIQTRGEKVASNAITTTSTTTVVHTNGQVQVQLVKSRPFIVLPKYIPKKTSVAVNTEGKKENREKLENVTGDKNQDIYSSYDRLIPEQ